MSEINRLVENSLDDVFVLTNNISAKCIKNSFAVINMTELSNFSDGLGLATCLDTARSLIKAVIPRTTKAYLVWDLEWMYKPHDFNKVSKVFNSDLKIIVRSSNHAQVIENLFGRKTDMVLRHFSLKEILHELCPSI